MVCSTWQYGPANQSSFSSPSAHLQHTRRGVQHVAVRSCQPVLQLTFSTQDVVCSTWQYGPANQSSFSSPGVVCSTWYYGTTRAKCSYNVMHVQQKQQCKMVTLWELWTRLDIPITRCHPLCKVLLPLTLPTLLTSSSHL